MVSYTLTGLLYSKKNYQLESKLNKICKKRNVFLATSMDFIELTIKNSEIKPKFIFCDLSTINLIDYKMKAFTSRQEFKDVNIIFINNGNNQGLKFESNYDNIHYVSIENFEELFDKLLHEVDIAKMISGTYSVNNYQLNNDIYKLLSLLGFSVKFTGYKYLCDCIKNVILNDCVIKSLTSEQYVYVATKYKTNVVNVERNIRNAINETWKKYGNDWYKILYSKALEIGLKPTNRDFINMCSQVITINAKYQIKTINNI